MKNIYNIFCLQRLKIYLSIVNINRKNKLYWKLFSGQVSALLIFSHGIACSTPVFILLTRERIHASQIIILLPLIIVSLYYSAAKNRQKTKNLNLALRTHKSWTIWLANFLIIASLLFAIFILTRT